MYIQYSHLFRALLMPAPDQCHNQLTNQQGRVGAVEQSCADLRGEPVLLWLHAFWQLSARGCPGEEMKRSLPASLGQQIKVSQHTPFPERGKGASFFGISYPSTLYTAGVSEAEAASGGFQRHRQPGSCLLCDRLRVCWPSPRVWCKAENGGCTLCRHSLVPGRRHGGFYRPCARSAGAAQRLGGRSCRL